MLCPLAEGFHSGAYSENAIAIALQDDFRQLPRGQFIIDQKDCLISSTRTQPLGRLRTNRLPTGWKEDLECCAGPNLCFHLNPALVLFYDPVHDGQS